jgi:hypothetical protein
METKNVIALQKLIGAALIYLAKNQFGEEEVYVAGGMPRDHFLGRVGNDYDIYLPAPKTQIEPSMAAMFLTGTGLFDNAKLMDFKEDESWNQMYYNGDEIAYILNAEVNLEKLKDYIEEEDSSPFTDYRFLGSSHEILEDIPELCAPQKVQFIFLKRQEVTSYFKEFTATLSQIWMGQDQNFCVTGLFSGSVVAKKIWFQYPSNLNQIKWVRKMMNRFQGEFELFLALPPGEPQQEITEDFLKITEEHITQTIAEYGMVKTIIEISEL